MKKTAQFTILVVTVLLLTSCRGMKNSPYVSDAQQQMPITDITSVDTSAFIGEEAAKEIALKKAEVTADEVSFIKVELDNDDGIWEYEIEFTKDGLEYEADIKADDGAILSWDIDKNN